MFDRLSKQVKNLRKPGEDMKRTADVDQKVGKIDELDVLFSGIVLENSRNS